MLQVRNSNSPKGGLTAKRSYRWLAIGLIALAVSAIALSGCKDNSDPYINPGNVEDPQWKITVDTTDMTASMTAIVKVSFTDKPGTLAAFMGDDCGGIADYIDGLYYLYISPSANSNANVQLQFYSPDLKRVFVSKQTFPFVNDGNQGSVSAPFTPEWDVAK